MNQVHGHGPANAKLAIVGEAPGGVEEQTGLPFQGPTGQMVNDFLLKAGCPRGNVYATNVARVRPPGNDINLLHQIGYKISDFEEILWAELNALNPNAVIAFGNTALKSLTGFTGIEKYRGSILPALKGNFKVIPTIHPASLMHKEADGRMTGWKDATFIQWDVNRGVYQSSFPDFRIPSRNLIIARSNLELYRFFNRYQQNQHVAVDIETFRTIPICISFAFNSVEAISVPLFPSMNKELNVTRSDQIANWRDILEIMANPKIQKIGQNFKFDETLLRTCLNGTLDFGINTRGFFFDTMLAFRTLYPELPGTLAFQTSVLTEEPYYKEEGKGYNPRKDKIDRLLLYNAKDAVITYECFEKELSELRERKLEQFFFERVMPLHPFYSRLEQRGIRRDNFAKHFLEAKYKDLEKEKAIELNGLTRQFDVEAVNVNSPKQVGLLMYVAMKLPIRKGTGEKEIDALQRNVVRDPVKKRILELILELRKIRKTLGTYINAGVDSKGRIKTSYRIMLETGRTSTSVLKPPITTETQGLALQTLTKHGDVGSDLRTMLIPDEGFVFIEPDLSQAEDRVVSVLARDLKGQLIYKYKIDKHRVTAGWIFDRTPDKLLNDFFDNPSFELANEINKILREKINDEERQLGKMFRHAGNYNMGKKTAASNIGMSELKAGKILDKFHLTNPNIRDVFHKEVIDFLNKNNRTLTNPFGRQRQFLNKWGDELFKEAFAQIPQSTVSDQLKFAMLRIELKAPWLQFLQESHDSFLCQCPINKVDETLPIIKEELEQPINFDKCSLGSGELIIPCDISIGKSSWGEMEKINWTETKQLINY